MSLGRPSHDSSKECHDPLPAARPHRGSFLPSGLGRRRRGRRRLRCRTRPHGVARDLRRGRSGSGRDGAGPGRSLDLPAVRPRASARCVERQVRGAASCRGRRRCSGSGRCGGRRALRHGRRGGLRDRHRCRRRLHPHPAPGYGVRVVRAPSHARARAVAHGRRRRGPCPAVTPDGTARRARCRRHVAGCRSRRGGPHARRHDGRREAAIESPLDGQDPLARRYRGARDVA